MEKLLKILSSIRPDVDFQNAEDLIDDGIIDSIGIVTLVTEINSAFDMKIPVEEVVAKNFNSVQAIMDLITRLDEE